MKKFILIVCVGLYGLYSYGQVQLDDFGRIILNTYIPEKMEIPEESKQMLKTKIDQITTANGMGGSDANPRFIITASINVGTKDIIAGPPQMIAQNFELTLFIGDALLDIIYSNVVIDLKGVGTNENKAFISAFKNINTRNKAIIEFLEEGKMKIINYYNTQCDFILKEANTLANQDKFEEAIYNLSLVPQVSKECYTNSSELITTLYQQKINADCKNKLSQAKIVWSGQQDINTAENVLNILMNVHPDASCINDVNGLINQISNKLLADEKERLDLALKNYNDKINLEKKRIEAYKDIAVQHARNQPRTITYQNIFWR